MLRTTARRLRQREERNESTDRLTAATQERNVQQATPQTTESQGIKSSRSHAPSGRPSDGAPKRSSRTDRLWAAWWDLREGLDG